MIVRGLVFLTIMLNEVDRVDSEQDLKWTKTWSMFEKYSRHNLVNNPPSMIQYEKLNECTCKIQF